MTRSAKNTHAADSLVALVGKRIRQLRTARDLSLRELGKIAGVHPMHVMAVELGQVAASTKTIKAIAKGLEVEPLDLLNFDTEHDDIGAIVEAMRVKPELVQTVRQRAQLLVVN